MSRSTQFIGLTQEAKQVVESLEEVESDTSTFGMFEEKIPLRKWEYPPSFGKLGWNGKWIIREKVQRVQWSSGPMIFTCLEIEEENDNKYECFQWICDPRVKCGVDYEQGTYYV